MTEAGRAIPTAVIGRLPALLRALDAAERRGDDSISSDDLAGSLGVTAAAVRRDLASLGCSGTRGVGYDVLPLRHQIAAALDLDADRPVAIVGIGNLGAALAAYPGFAEHGFRIAAVFDSNPTVVGGRAGGLEILDISELAGVVAALRIRMAIVAVPAAAAQQVADQLVRAGVVSLLTFAPVALNVPGHVRVRRSDLAAELQILAFHARSAPPQQQVVALP